MIRQLSATAGLPLTFDLAVGALACPAPLVIEKVVQRRMAAMVPMYRDPAGQDPERLLYYMTYDIRFPEDEAALRALGLRYDVTVLLPGAVGGEPIKTAGHYHPAEPTSGRSYPEIYTVLSGRAHYLLQRDGATPGDVDEAVLIEAEAGDKLLIPPGYGHISINPGPEPLVMANLVAADCKPDYGPIRDLRGGCYLPVGTGDGRLEYERNPRYGQVAALRVARAADLPALGVDRKVPLYTAFAHEPERFRYVALPGTAGAPNWAAARCWE